MKGSDDIRCRVIDRYKLSSRLTVQKQLRWARPWTTCRKPDSAAEKPMQGEIVAAGNGKIQENGDVRPLDVKVGDTVLFGKYSGTEVKVEGEELLMMREDDIMGVIEA